MDLSQKEIDERGEIGYCCDGCSRVTPNYRCSSYLQPEDKWAHSGCMLADHIQRGVKKIKKTRVGQQKQKRNWSA